MTSRARWREALVAATPMAVSGTLLCCALPMTLVALGAGSVVASTVSVAPWLTVLSAHKAWVFLVAGGMLLASYRVLYRSDAPTCRVGGVCHPSHPFGRWMRRTFQLSVLLYLIGLSAAYLALPVSEALGF